MSGSCCSFHVQCLSTQGTKRRLNDAENFPFVPTDLDLGEGGQHGEGPLHGEGDGGVHRASERYVDQGQHVGSHEGEHVILCLTLLMNHKIV